MGIQSSHINWVVIFVVNFNYIVHVAVASADLCFIGKVEVDGNPSTFKINNLTHSHSTGREKNHPPLRGFQLCLRTVHCVPSYTYSMHVYMTSTLHIVYMYIHVHVTQPTHILLFCSPKLHFHLYMVYFETRKWEIQSSKRTCIVHK